MLKCLERCLLYMLNEITSYEVCSHFASTHTQWELCYYILMWFRMMFSFFVISLYCLNFFLYCNCSLVQSRKKMSFKNKMLEKINSWIYKTDEMIVFIIFWQYFQINCHEKIWILCFLGKGSKINIKNSIFEVVELN